MESSEDLKSLRELMEFYFGDNNLSKDRFMTQKISENEGYVELEVLGTFNKVKKLTEGKECLAMMKQAIKSSSLLQLSEDEKKVKRSTPVAEGGKNAKQCVYVENFPANADHDFFQKLFQGIGGVAYVSLPRWEDRSLKGFGFVDFTSEESAQRAVKELNQYNEDTNPTGLWIMLKTHWLELRRRYEEILNRQNRKKGAYETKVQTKKRKIEAGTSNNNANNKKEEVPVQKMETEKTEKTEDFQKGGIIEISSMRNDLTKPEIKEILEAEFPVAHVDYRNGNNFVTIRCFTPEEARKLSEAIGTLKQKLGENMKLRILEGIEEKQYWDLFLSVKKKKGNPQQTYNNYNQTSNKQPRKPQRESNKPKRTSFGTGD